MAVDTSSPRSRRALLGAAVTAAAAAAAAAMPASVAAADPNDVVLGADNSTTTRTKIFATATGTGHAAIVGSNTSPSGVGLLGEAAQSGGIGVLGTGYTAGLKGTSVNAIGVVGEGQTTGVAGSGAIGVHGSGNTMGVYGEQAQYGVVGTGISAGVQGLAFDDTGVGVHGYVQTAGQAPLAPSQPAVGVLAEASDNSFTALHVLGRVRFSRAGKASMSSTQTSKAITKSGVTTASYVIGTLQTRVSGLYILAIVPGAGKFTIYLNKAPGKTVYIGYLVIN